MLCCFQFTRVNSSHSTYVMLVERANEMINDSIHGSHVWGCTSKLLASIVAAGVFCLVKAVLAMII